MLDDGTAIGDAQVLATIFAKRVQERDALKAVVDAFNEVLPAEHGAEALAALQERFAALVQRDDSIPCRAALDAVQTYRAARRTPDADRPVAANLRRRSSHARVRARG